MSFKLKQRKIDFINLFLLYLIVTIGLASSSNETRVFIELIRSLSVVLIFFIVGISLLTSKINYNIVVSILVVGIFFTTGTLLSIFFGGLQDFKSDIITLTLTIIGCYVFSSKHIPINQNMFAKWVIVYCILIFVISIMLGGLVFSPIPTFVYGYASDSIGKEIYYSQGISKIFGYGALAATSLVVYEKSKTKKYALALIVLFFIALSLLGGARGDSLFVIILVVFYFLYRLDIMNSIIAILFVSISFIFIASFISFEDFIIFNRLKALSDNYGSRDVLFEQSVSLLYNEPQCFVHGCGFGFFQSYYNYRLGLYPHNFVIELIIVFGFPIAVFMMLLFTKGFFNYIKNNQDLDFIVLLIIYTLALGLKSGSINTNWLFLVFFLFFITYYITSKWKKNII
jgi:hypothetical protein